MDIWEELKRSAQSVLDEGQKVGRSARLKVQVRSLETELGDLIYDLGTRALDLHRRNELHHYELDQLFADIQTKQRDLRRLEAEIEGKAGRVAPANERDVCLDCGQVAIDDDRFCRSCGARLKG